MATTTVATGGVTSEEILRDVRSRVAEAGSGDVVVDLRTLTTLDGRTVEALVSAAIALDARGAALVLLAPTDLADLAMRLGLGDVLAVRRERHQRA